MCIIIILTTTFVWLCVCDVYFLSIITYILLYKPLTSSDSSGGVRFQWDIYDSTAHSVSDAISTAALSRLGRWGVGLAQGIHRPIRHRGGRWPVVSLWQCWGDVKRQSWKAVQRREPLFWKNEKCEGYGCNLLYIRTYIHYLMGKIYILSDQYTINYAYYWRVLKGKFLIG